VIGPLLRSSKRTPRRSPVVPSPGRRLENLAADALERLTSPFGFWRFKRLVVERRDVVLEGLARSFDGYRVAFLTDLHASAVVPAWWIERAVETALGLDPDLVLLGGDYLSHGDRYAGGLAALLRPLTARDGVYGVLGNHDHYVGADVVRRALREAGLVELRNRAVTLERGGGRLAVAGVGDLGYDVVDPRVALAGVDPDVPRLVVSHDPDVFAYWPADVRCDLMLSGHTHGGQAHLPILGPPYVPSQFGFRYLAGAVREGGRQLYVSRGIGVITAPIRWRCPAELTCLILHPS
jgi:uncharacterized protein